MKQQLRKAKKDSADNLAAKERELEESKELKARWHSNFRSGKRKLVRVQSRLDGGEEEDEESEESDGGGEGEGEDRGDGEGEVDPIQEDSDEPEEEDKNVQDERLVFKPRDAERPLKHEASRSRHRRMAGRVSDALTQELPLDGDGLEHTPQTTRVRATQRADLNAEACAAYCINNNEGATLVMRYLLERRPTLVSDIIEQCRRGGEFPDALRRLERVFAPAVVKRLRDHWTRERCLAIISYLRISWVKYQLLLNLLSKEYDEELMKWKTVVLYGGRAAVKFPKLQPKDKLLALRKSIHDKYGLKVAEDAASGEGAVLDVEPLIGQLAMDVLKRRAPAAGAAEVEAGAAEVEAGAAEVESGAAEVEAAVEAGRLGLVMLALCLSGDAHKLFKGVSVTRIAIKVKEPKGSYTHNPLHLGTCLLVEGPDKYENLRDALKEPMKQLTGVLRNGIRLKMPRGADYSATFPGCTCTMAGDMPFQQAVNGLGGGAAECGCGECTAPREEWAELADAAARAALRTFEVQCMLAHMPFTDPFVEFTCPKCGKKFSTMEDVDNDVGPAHGIVGKKKIDKANLDYRRVHSNTTHHQPPQFPCYERRLAVVAERVLGDEWQSRLHELAAAIVADPTKGTLIIRKAAIDIMHMMLREVARCFHGTIQEQVTEEETADMLNEAMRTMGINLESKIATRKKGELFGEGCAAVQFIGDHCDKVLVDTAKGRESKILNVVCAKMNEDERGQIEELWSRLVALVKLTVDTLLDDTTENRATRASDVKEAADAYVEVYMAVVDVASASVFPNYLHEIKSHLYMYIEHHGKAVQA